MEEAASVEQFVRAPVGRWIVVATTLLWCKSPTMGGASCWGRPDGVSARLALRGYEAYQRLAPSFDAIIDGSALESIHPDAVFEVMGWMRREMTELTRRVRRQLGVLPSGLDGLILAGIAPPLGDHYPIELVDSTRTACARLLPVGGDALADEIEAIVARVRGLPLLLVGLRAQLRERDGRLTIEEAAAAFHCSVRTLQRQLADAQTSFRAEQNEARFDRILRLLTNTDDKIGAIAAQLGMTGTALSVLVRRRTGRRPQELRVEARRTPR